MRKLLRGKKLPAALRLLLQERKLTKAKSLDRVSIQRVNGQQWAFIRFSDITEVEEAFANRGNLKGSRVFIIEAKDIAAQEKSQ